MSEWFRATTAGLMRRYNLWRDAMSDGHFAMVRSTVIAVLVLAAGAGVYVAGKPAWNAWRHRRAMSQAMIFAEKQDYRNTLLALKRATELAPLDLATWRAVSERLAELGSPEAIMARENVVRLAPGDMSMRLALVTEALRFGQVDVARMTLDELGEAAQADAAFHRLAAAVAMATGESARLEEHLAALVAAQPEDTTARFNLAAVRLWDADPARQATAVAELEKLTAVRDVRVRASLELLKHAARSGDGNRARRVLDLILDAMGVAPPLRMSYDGSPPGWNALVQGLQETSEFTGPADVALVARWLGDVRLRREALAWIDRLPAALRDAPAVLRVNTGLTAEIDDHDRLVPLLWAGGLGPLSADAVWLAIASRVQHLRYQAPRARATWEDAVTACSGSSGALSALARLADIWHDVEGNERALQELLKVQPRLNWVYVALRNSYLARGSTLQLWQLYGVWAAIRPDDPALMQSWLSLGAVLDRLTPDARARAIARAEADGAGPLDLALGAASRWRANELDAAVALLDRVPTESRGRPDIAFWRAVILAQAAGREAEARAAVLQARGPRLSAEENALLTSVEKVTSRPAP